MIKISSNSIYSGIYNYLKDAKEKKIKIILNKNLQGVLLVDVSDVVSTDSIFFNIDEKQYYFMYTQISINILILEFLSQNGNRGKIKLRNFFYKSHKKLWEQI